MEGDFGYSDGDSDTLDHVTITSLPKDAGSVVQGTLKLNNTIIPESELPKEVDSDDIGNLTYTPPNSEYGASFASFDFTVYDGFDDSAPAATITINVTNVLDNADLSVLDISAGPLTLVPEKVPEFNEAAPQYTVNVANDVASVTVVPTTDDQGGKAVVKVGDTEVPDGVVSLVEGGDTIITVVVTAEDGATTKTYTYTVTREGSSNADLSALTIKGGALNETFAADTVIYTVDVANDVAGVTVTPTAAHSSATVTVNGTTVPSGSASGEIPVAEGGTVTIAVEVTAQDGTTKTYTIEVTRVANAPARFRRLNDEILSKHALTLADVTIAAVTSRQEAGPTCADQATTGSLGGQSSLAEILTPSNAQTLTTDSLNLKQLLGTSAFRLRLTEDGAGPGCLTLWGQGDYRNLSSSDAQALDWDGDLVTGQVGVDALLQPDLRAGLAVSWSEGDFDYTDRTDGRPYSGAYGSRMMSVHPYLTWWSPMGLDLWATGGYGQGEIEIEDEQAGTHPSDTTLRLASVGASGLLPIGDALIAGGTTSLRVKAQASVAQMDVEGHGALLQEQTIDAQRLRLALEGSHERMLASGGSLTPSLEVGLRHDGGDVATGTGLELGGGLRYVDPALGLTVEGRGRVLAAYEEAYEEWGASGLIRLDPGAAGLGLALSLVPSYGQTASGVQRLWDQGLTRGSPQGAPTTQAPTGRLAAEVGYGLAAFAGHGLVTPYSAAMLGGGTQQYRVGSRLELGPALRLSLEGTRQVTTVGQANQGIWLQADWQF